MTYFLLSSGTLFVVLGLVFFGLGLWLGRALWGGYKERNELRERELSSARSRVQALQVELRKLQQEPPAEGGEYDALEARHQQTLEQLHEQEELHRQALERVRELEGVEQRLQQLEASEPSPVADPVAAEGETAELRERLRRVEAELEMEKGDNASLNADLSATARRAQQAEQRINAMLRERDTLRDDLRELQSLQLAAEAESVIARQSASPVTQAQPAAVAADDGAHVDAELGTLYNAPPAAPDDLTRIKGIGNVLQDKLNGYGVYTFSQIAHWDEPQIAAFSSRLSFKERIQRDDWVGQAKRLQQENGR